MRVTQTIGIVTLALAGLLALNSLSAAETTSSRDIQVTKYETVQIQQGQSNVRPIFWIKNTGDRFYKNIHISTTSPKGTHRGEEVSLKESGDYRKVTLGPGEELDLFPGYALSASPDQAMTAYAMPYSILFEDDHGHTFQTPPVPINEYARVVAFNSDIKVTGYDTVRMHQGQGNVKPVFELQNDGAQLYKNIHISTTSPKGRFRGEETSLKESGDYRKITLAAGETARLFPGYALSATPTQPMTTYSMPYSLRFEDEHGHSFTTPPTLIKAYAEVIPWNDAISIASYRTVILSPGESGVKPIMILQDRGDRAYRDIYVTTQSPKGRYRGEEVSLREYGDYKKTYLAPGESRVYFHGYSLSAAQSQAPGLYAMDYSIRFADDDGHSYQTPSSKIPEYALVTGPTVSQEDRRSRFYRSRRAQHKTASNRTKPTKPQGKETESSGAERVLDSVLDASLKRSGIDPSSREAEQAKEFGKLWMNPLADPRDIQKKFDELREQFSK